MIRTIMSQQEHHWARQALQRLEKEGLPPLPKFYEMFYIYYAGKNANLQMAIDTLAREFGSITMQQCENIYNAHLGIDNEHKALNDANTALEAELKKVMTMIDEASSGTKKFDATLTSFAGDLNQEKPQIDMLKIVVARVAQETKTMADQNKRLQERLKDSTDQISELRFNLDKTRQESLQDPLTEVGNRKFFDAEVERLVKEAATNGEPLSLCMIDIDFFKKFNDNYGHQVGDQVLKLVGRTLKENVKGRDVVARYGGEEFAVLLPQTRLEDAGRVANLLRISVGNKRITRKNTQETLGTITLSVGVTQYRIGETVGTMIERADTALYKAKGDGRNQVAMAVLPQ
ncbi:MAG: diguanylate cyclase [Alphaproteobacteria bacterium]|nr:diguanylate cyclase [Alphaproteobacteria bacterium]